MTTCTASIDSTGADATLHRTVLASLPNRYRLVDGAAEVVLVSATDAAKFERALAGGTRAVVLDQPGRLSPQELASVEDAADRHGCILVPATRYGPRLAAGPDLLDGAAVGLVESTIIARDGLRSSLVEQLALIRPVLGAASSVRVLHCSASNYVLEATMVNHPFTHVLLNGFVSSVGEAEASLHAIGAERRLAVRIQAGPLARPAHIQCFDTDGTHSPWPLHQHAHRITLTRLHRLLTMVEDNLVYGLADLRHDVQLAAALTQ